MDDVLSIICARGGSKGIPGKNIAEVGGRPLIAWTIAASLATKSVSRTIVSTDSTEIRDVSIKCGAEVPFLRPAELAQDNTPGVQPVLHAIRWLEEHEKYLPQFVMLLQPTSPMRNSSDIDSAIRLLENKGADAVVSVCPVSKHPFWMKKMNSRGVLEDLVKTDRIYSSRQELPPALALNGAIYLIRSKVLLAEETLFPAETLGYVMPVERSIDIDTPWDQRLVNLLLRNNIESV